MRGNITEKIKIKAISYFPNGITTLQLRLMPYICYVAQNEKRINRDRISVDEEDELMIWIENGWITSPFEQIKIRKDFWTFMNELIYYSYVDISEDLK